MPGCVRTRPSPPATRACPSTGCGAARSPTTTRTSTTASWDDEASPRTLPCEGGHRYDPALDGQQQRRHGAVRRHGVAGLGPDPGRDRRTRLDDRRSRTPFRRRRRRHRNAASPLRPLASLRREGRSPRQQHGADRRKHRQALRQAVPAVHHRVQPGRLRARQRDLQRAFG